MQAQHKMYALCSALHRTCNLCHLNTPYYIACFALSCILRWSPGDGSDMGQTSARLAATFPAHRAPEPAAARPGLSLLERIGNTPLLRFDQLTVHLPPVTLLGKAEWHNPGGSVKDR